MAKKNNSLLWILIIAVIIAVIIGIVFYFSQVKEEYTGPTYKGFLKLKCETAISTRELGKELYREEPIFLIGTRETYFKAADLKDLEGKKFKLDLVQINDGNLIKTLTQKEILEMLPKIIYLGDRQEQVEPLTDTDTEKTIVQKILERLWKLKIIEKKPSPENVKKFLDFIKKEYTIQEYFDEITFEVKENPGSRGEIYGLLAKDPINSSLKMTSEVAQKQARQRFLYNEFLKNYCPTSKEVEFPIQFKVVSKDQDVINKFSELFNEIPSCKTYPCDQEYHADTGGKYIQGEDLLCETGACSRDVCCKEPPTCAAWSQNNTCDTGKILKSNLGSITNPSKDTCCRQVTTKPTDTTTDTSPKPPTDTTPKPPTDTTPLDTTPLDTTPTDTTPTDTTPIDTTPTDTTPTDTTPTDTTPTDITPLLCSSFSCGDGTELISETRICENRKCTQENCCRPIIGVGDSFGGSGFGGSGGSSGGFGGSGGSSGVSQSTITPITLSGKKCSQHKCDVGYKWHRDEVFCGDDDECNKFCCVKDESSSSKTTAVEFDETNPFYGNLANLGRDYTTIFNDAIKLHTEYGMTSSLLNPAQMQANGIRWPDSQKFYEKVKSLLSTKVDVDSKKLEIEMQFYEINRYPLPDSEKFDVLEEMMNEDLYDNLVDKSDESCAEKTGIKNITDVSETDYYGRKGYSSKFLEPNWKWFSFFSAIDPLDPDRESDSIYVGNLNKNDSMSNVETCMSKVKKAISTYDRLSDEAKTENENRCKGLVNEKLTCLLGNNNIFRIFTNKLTATQKQNAAMAGSSRVIKNKLEEKKYDAFPNCKPPNLILYTQGYNLPDEYKQGYNDADFYELCVSPGFCKYYYGETGGVGNKFCKTKDSSPYNVDNVRNGKVFKGGSTSIYEKLTSNWTAARGQAMIDVDGKECKLGNFKLFNTERQNWFECKQMKDCECTDDPEKKQCSQFIADAEANETTTFCGINKTLEQNNMVYPEIKVNGSFTDEDSKDNFYLYDKNYYYNENKPGPMKIFDKKTFSITDASFI
jgi:hypothetical protein